jgi:hypothetical protein
MFNIHKMPLDNFTIDTIPKASKSFPSFVMVIWPIVADGIVQNLKHKNPFFPMFGLLTQAQILLNVKPMHWVEHVLFSFMAHFMLH